MRVKTPVGELYLEEAGDRSAPAVVLWHSFLHHGGMWRAQVEALQSRYFVLNVDAPGHGRSSALTAPLSMNDCAEALLRVLDAKNISQVAMVGLSWGGMVAMQLAVTRPDRLRAMALFDTSCRAEPIHNQLKYRMLGQVFRKVGAAPFLLDQIEPLFFSDRTRRAGRDLVDEWRSYVARLDRPSVDFGLSCIIGRRDLRAELANVDVPTLVVVGAHDAAQPPRESEHIASSIARARLAVIPEAGHLAALERPADANAILLDFLDDHLGGRSEAGVSYLGGA